MLVRWQARFGLPPYCHENSFKTTTTLQSGEDEEMKNKKVSIAEASAYPHAEERFIKTWLWRIVMNTAVDFIRKKQKEVAVDEFLENGREDDYWDFDTIEALKVLDEKEKTVIVLRFFEEQKIPDIAKILNENVNTVKTILYRSLKKLKVELSEYPASWAEQ